MDTASAEPLIGFRSWRIGEGGLLLSCTRDCVWKPYERMDATCNVRAHDGAAPAWRCLCGFYAYKTLAALSHSSYIGSRDDPRCAIGRVALWGRVIDHTFGYRAGRAYPQVLYLRGDRLDEDVRRVAERYAIECVPSPIELKEFTQE